MVDYKRILSDICGLSSSDAEIVVSKEIQELSSFDNKKLNKYFNELLFIFVGDNPGDHEKEDGVYFSSNGKSGSMLSEFIKYLELEDKKCLYLNKSLITTHETKDLFKYYSNDKTQEKVAELINETLKNNKKVYVCLFGVEYYNKENAGIFSRFYKKLEMFKYKKRIGLFNHISRRYPISLYEQDIIKKKNLEEFKTKIFQKYGLVLLKRYKSNAFSKAIKSVKIDLACSRKKNICDDKTGL